MRRISIVFAESEDRDAEGHQTFHVFLESPDGDAELERLNTVPDDQLSGAEFWAKLCFGIVGDVLNESGAIKDVQVPS